MKQAAALVFAIATSFAAQAHASADTDMRSAIEVAVSDTGAVSGSRQIHQVLRGVVAAVDERRDRITVRLSADATTDLKVQDGLLFNAVRYGDQVEVTVEDINGTKTIVGLMKE
jgi:hypothetical protein